METNKSITLLLIYQESEAIIPFYKAHFLDKLICLENKQPKWNSGINSNKKDIATKMYTLDFDKRVALPSVRNFQLVDSDNSIMALF